MILILLTVIQKRARLRWNDLKIETETDFAADIKGASMSQKHITERLFDSPYLSSADIVDAISLTIACVRLELDHTKKTKDSFNTAYFVEKKYAQEKILSL